MPPRPVVLSWSSGKDSAWALKLLRDDPNFDVVGLLTTYCSSDRRVPVQYTRIELVHAQARHLGLPLISAALPNPCSAVEYESTLNLAAMEAQAEHEVEAIAFADISIRDIRHYREQFFSAVGLKTIFPLWGRDSRQLGEEMIAAGQKTWISAVDTNRLPASFVGREYDLAFLNDLPEGIDACGEYGEFHTFCWGGPVFGTDLDIVKGTQLVHGNYAYQDFLPSGRDLGVDPHLAPRHVSVTGSAGEQVVDLHEGEPMRRPAVVRPSQFNLPSVPVITPPRTTP